MKRLLLRLLIWGLAILGAWAIFSTRGHPYPENCYEQAVWEGDHYRYTGVEICLEDLE